jgi:hypothetical protein
MSEADGIGARRPPHLRQLLRALSQPGSIAALDASILDVLVRAARTVRLLGVLAARIHEQGIDTALPESVQAHLRAALAEAAHRRQMVLRQLDGLEQLFQALGISPVALKGAGYILAGRRCAAGRLLRDVDLMVPKAELAAVERRLLETGWEFTKTSPYDQHYYRAWSHELPPMRGPAMPMELDLHHAILPPTGRLRPPTEPLLERSVAAGAWRVLSIEDQVLHAAAHLFEDSDCIHRLNDLVDVDALLREGLAAGDGFVERLRERAVQLRLGRPLWYAAVTARAWLDTPIDVARLRPLSPGWPGRALVLGCSARVLGPTDPNDEPGVVERAARVAMQARSHWLRMPPGLLAWHAANKALRPRPPPGDQG